MFSASNLLSLTVLAALLFPLNSQALTQKQLIENPLAMTITQAVALPTKDSTKTGRLLALPSRGSTFLLEDRRELRYRYQLQPKKSAPLAFVIPGAGATASSSGGLFLGEKLFRLGYHIVVLDNPFSWTFTVSGSRSGLPGYVPRDAEDLYSVMQKVADQLKSRRRIQPSNYALVGYSLGALDTLFVKRLDDAAGIFNFSRLFLISPPLDLMNGFQSLDRLAKATDHFSTARKERIVGRVLNIVEKYLMSDKPMDFTDPSFLVRAFNDLGLSSKDLMYLISKTFRDNLRDIVFASQQVKELRILKNTVSRYRRNARYAEAASFNFEQYVDRFLVPNVLDEAGVNYSVAELNDRSSIYQFAGLIENDTRIFAVHSADDFILKSGDVEWMQKHFGQRFVLFPYGGHCGAMNFPQLTQFMSAAMKL